MGSPCHGTCVLFRGRSVPGQHFDRTGCLQGCLSLAGGKHLTAERLIRNKAIAVRLHRKTVFRSKQRERGFFSGSDNIFLPYRPDAIFLHQIVGIRLQGGHIQIQQGERQQRSFACRTWCIFVIALFHNDTVSLSRMYLLAGTIIGDSPIVPSRDFELFRRRWSFPAAISHLLYLSRISCQQISQNVPFLTQMTYCHVITLIYRRQEEEFRVRLMRTRCKEKTHMGFEHRSGQYRSKAFHHSP
jgi:hypothetical protein